ncbi:hypothetical protein O6H91_Y153900 [Diphasiastrum complanatum]|nr:hypothetical protein O6H91_Y153900 [Diphasiastrum complanatum]
MAASLVLRSSLSKCEQLQVFNGSIIIRDVKSSVVPIRSDFIVTSTFLRSHGSLRSLPRLNISCMSQVDPKEGNTNEVPTATNTVPPLTTDVPTATTPVAPKKMSTKFGDVFAFTGPAPEKINGRLAMLGFVSALGVEIVTGQDLVAQLGNGGLTWFFVTAILFTSASLIPLFKGISAESKSESFFSSQAETLNGRAAMVGLVALVLTEYVKGSPLL